MSKVLSPQVTLLFLVLLFVSFRETLSDSQSAENKDFYDACANGNIKRVREYLDDNADLAKSATKDGETCLHLTAVSKSIEVAKLVIDLDADVNYRTTHPQGLRMMPLSWHAWGGNVDIITLLLDAGAEINADFDFSLESGAKVTATDIAAQFIASRDPNGERDSFVDTYELLTQRGGKKYEELYPDSPHILSLKTSKDNGDEF